MEDRGKELREAIEESRGGKKRWRCPSSLRSEAVSYLKARRESGSLLSSLSVELGISGATVSRWLEEGSGELRPVRVTDAPVLSGELRLVTPRGYRIEGLCVASAAALLARL